MTNFKILEKYEDTLKIYENETFEIYSGYKTGNDDEDKAFFIKIWSKPSSDQLIQEIWLYEIRQLQALKNTSDAHNYLSLIYDYYKDDECVAIIYECNTLNEQFYNQFLDNLADNRTLKAKYLFSRNRLENPLNRKKLWQQLLQIANGIKILHEKNLMHRNININNLLVCEEKTENELIYISKFRLTGFDLLLSLHSFDETPNLYESEETELSFDNDWYLFGKLIQHFLFINEINIDSIYNDLPNYLSYKEKHLISSLLSIPQTQNSSSYKTNYIDYNFVINKIEQIIKMLGSENATNLFYLLTIHNKINTDLFEFDQNDSSTQNEQLLKAIMSDLDSDEVSITRVPQKENEEYTYLLHGHKYIYKIKSIFNRQNKKNDWNKAEIREIYNEKPYWANFSSVSQNFKIKISLISKESRDSTGNISWLNIINCFPQKNKMPLYSKSFLESMLLCYALEVVDYLAKIFVIDTPIKIEKDNHNLKNNNSESTIKVVVNDEQPHEQYSQIINTQSIKKVLNELTNKKSNNLEKDWLISLKIPDNRNDFSSYSNEDSTEFDSDTIKIELIYDKKHNGYYYFNLSNNSLSAHDEINKITTRSQNGKLYLYPKSLKGNFTSILRKKYALELISNNHLLIKSIVNPIDSTFKLNYPFSYIPEVKELDSSKKEIYKQVLETYPNFVVQGPPGVGKTFLITTLLKQIFNDEKNSRVILSAQSHSTVQVLYEEMLNLGLPEDLLQINEFYQENDDISPSEDNEYISEQLTTNNLINNTLKDLFESDLWKHSLNEYSSIKHEMIEFKDKNINTHHALREKIINSANIVLTTTNSKAIENILRNSTYSDWTIMEESGKASGLELISPLLLAPKRLMIGDNKQLPAFFEKHLHKILEKLTYKDLLVIYQPMLDRIMKPSVFDLLKTNQFIEEIELVLMNKNDSNFDDDNNSSIVDIQKKIDSLKTSTAKYFSLLDYLVRKSDEIKNKDSSKQMGEIITEQYRMHPNISKLISYVFYNKILVNNKINEKKYLNIENRAFYYKNNHTFLNKNIGIHVLNIKEPNEKNGIKSIENQYTNEAELYIIKDVLEDLYIKELSSKKPTITILSPYKKQVDFINNKLQQTKTVESLLQKGFDIKGSNLCKTIDSFQGGEADIIIISLVRHNINNNIYEALGFLLDMRRLNVMLSRAKYQMIIVGSLGMFEYWIKNRPKNISEEILDKLKMLYELITDPKQNIAEVIDVTDSVKES